MKCPDCGSRWPNVLVAHAQDHGTHFCGKCKEWFTVTRKKRSPMIRFVFMAALFGALGAGGASVDWRDQWDHVQDGWDGAVEQWNAPRPMDVDDFFFWRQCDNCFDLSRHDERACCAICGSTQSTSNVRARLIEYTWKSLKNAYGYQTADGLLYIMKNQIDQFDDQFVIGSDVYKKSEAIIAHDVKLK